MAGKKSTGGVDGRFSLLEVDTKWPIHREMQVDNSGSFWSSRSQMRLQSRRSQSREDLSSSLAESHMLKM
ncbi:hypothetical protein YC2023_008320 [Brassica napus]